MKLWSYQPKSVITQLEQDKLFYGDLNKFRDNFQEGAFRLPDFERAYAWMKKQMELKTKVMPFALEEIPLWAWTAQPDITNPEFKYSYQANINYLLEIEVPDNEVLISHLGAWHAVLGNRLLATQDESQRLESFLNDLSDEEWVKFVQASWQDIFNLEVSMDLYKYMKPPFHTQATFRYITPGSWKIISAPPLKIKHLAETP